MIKLIASDLDGTLLDDNKKLPENFSDTLSQLFDKKIRFVVSSGRSFASLKPLFPNYINELTFICDNGAFIYDKGKLVSVSVIPSDEVTEIVKFCTELGLIVLLCGKNGTWHNSDTSSGNKEIANYYINQEKMDDLTKCNDDIFKIAIFEEGGIEDSAYPKLISKFGNKFNCQLSGKYWVDIMNKGISKGVALKTLQNRLGINYESTMAFGDFLNDAEMLENAYYSFAMQNSHDSIKRIANFMTGSNNDNSVIKEIEKYCLN